MATINLKDITVKEAMPISYEKNPKTEVTIEGELQYGLYIFRPKNPSKNDKYKVNPYFELQVSDAHILAPDKSDPYTVAINNRIKKAKDKDGNPTRVYTFSRDARERRVDPKTGKKYFSRLEQYAQFIPDSIIWVINPETKTARKADADLLNELYAHGPVNGTKVRVVMGLGKTDSGMIYQKIVAIMFIGDPEIFKPQPAFLEAMGLTMEESEEPAEEAPAEEVPAEEAPAEVKAPAEAPAEEEVEDDVFGDEDF